MATDTKNFTDEERAAHNAKRRERNANRTSEEKERDQLRSRCNYQKVVEDSGKEHHFTADVRSISRQVMANRTGPRDFARRIENRVIARKKRLFNRLNEIEAWKQSGGHYPWPNAARTWRASELFREIATIIGRKCCNCGTTLGRDQNWRLCPKNDFLAFVPFDSVAYERVLRKPSAYEFYCIKCTFDNRLYAFWWIFGDSPRNNPKNETPLKREYLAQKLPEMYPKGEALRKKIRAGQLQSLSCQLRTPRGIVESILRKKPFYSYVGGNPRLLYDERFRPPSEKGQVQANPSIGQSETN